MPVFALLRPRPLQGAVFVSWVRDGARWRPRDAAPPAGSGSGSGGRLRAVTGELLSAVLVLEDDPDVYVPCFEARGLSADGPVVVRRGTPAGRR